MFIDRDFRAGIIKALMSECIGSLLRLGIALRMPWVKSDHRHELCMRLAHCTTKRNKRKDMLS